METVDYIAFYDELSGRYGVKVDHLDGYEIVLPARLSQHAVRLVVSQLNGVSREFEDVFDDIEEMVNSAPMTNPSELPGGNVRILCGSLMADAIDDYDETERKNIMAGLTQDVLGTLAVR